MGGYPIARLGRRYPADEFPVSAKTGPKLHQGKALPFTVLSPSFRCPLTAVRLHQGRPRDDTVISFDQALDLTLPAQCDTAFP